MTISGIIRPAQEIPVAQETSHRPAKESLPPKSFSEILKDRLAEKTENASSGAVLSGDGVRLLVQSLRLRMNAVLYQSVFSERRPFFSAAWSNFQKEAQMLSQSQVAASKSGQSVSKNDSGDNSAAFAEVIAEAAARHGVDADLICSVIRTESHFNPRATSERGAMGLMQLMPETARELGVKNAYDPRENVMGGTLYLKRLLERYRGQTDLALAAYNWGMGNLERNPDGLPRETVAYIEKVKAGFKSAKA